MEEIKVLDFDSGVFGMKIARFTGKFLTEDAARVIKKECKDTGIRCIYIDININDFNSLSVASKEGFLLTDVKITLQRKLKNPLEIITLLDGFEISDSLKKGDRKYLEQLSVELSETSRFAFDRNFALSSVHALYKTWLLNSLNGSAANKVFMVKDIRLQEPIGLVTCKNNSHHGEIVLIVVKDEYRGMSLGGALLNKSFHYFAQQGVSEVMVTTHGRTIDAQRFYQKNGFLTYSVVVSFHVWVN
ncbi:MAG TPA: hypothetical protein DCY56_06045 [Candidatus Omnitrophica bacterium]|nr:hypothetical protein [Candidatus Omnitrophota bacterium]